MTIKLSLNLQRMINVNRSTLWFVYIAEFMNGSGVNSMIFLMSCCLVFTVRQERFLEARKGGDAE